jgi:hypothetical protein
MTENDAIAQKPFCGLGNMVENRMLQIQHTDGNQLLTRLKEALKFPHFGAFAAVSCRGRLVDPAQLRRPTSPWT